ncbi:GNAT family N-acetyltransferase [Cytobacillus luteolus]|uniref:GNAT family N-acetyltransferase n=1 Tax=Litchfieldia luteola TaxID=682179 RepID=UPI001AE594BB|nr:GNAT family N-acetyltransferase [Cytobacillus luteolus]MBP1943305.1 CelD/BcsL family acetyltransferase involved in cellulose biosynthesis [Cytobacillus luteolus]
MHVIIHKQLSILEEIFPAWEVSKQEFYDVTIFQELGWLLNWWRYKSNLVDISPYIIEIKDGTKTIGIIPLYRVESFFYRVLKPIGADQSDYLMPILSKKYPPELLLKLALEKIFDDKKSWDYIDWGDVPEDSIFARTLNYKKMKYTKLIDSYKAVTCPYLYLDKDIEITKSKMNKPFMKKILYKERKILRERGGELTFSKVMKEEEIEPIMNIFFKFHCERWEKTDTPSKFRFKEEKEHALQSAKSLFKNNSLYLTYLSHEKDIVVVDFGMTDQKRLYLYLHAINIKYSRYSPGNLLLYHLILQACEEGYEIVDFLRGEEDYKQKWGTEDKLNLKYRIYNGSIKSLFYRLIYRTTRKSHFVKKYIKPFAMKVLGNIEPSKMVVLPIISLL